MIPAWEQPGRGDKQPMCVQADLTESRTLCTAHISRLVSASHLLRVRAVSRFGASPWSALVFADIPRARLPPPDAPIVAATGPHDLFVSFAPVLPPNAEARGGRYTVFYRPLELPPPQSAQCTGNVHVTSAGVSENCSRSSWASDCIGGSAGRGRGARDAGELTIISDVDEAGASVPASLDPSRPCSPDIVAAASHAELAALHRTGVLCAVCVNMPLAA
jgi:hypothetical protein